jgi:hypothetical protein
VSPVPRSTRGGPFTGWPPELSQASIDLLSTWTV